MDAISERRSIRRYTEEKVEAKDVIPFIKAAMNAPSAADQQPWRFIIIDDPAILKMVPEVHPYASMVPQASIAVLVCGDMELVEHGKFWIQDCAAATQNFLLAVADGGLGSVWLGVYAREKRVEGLSKLLNLPDNIVPFALLPVGYPAEEKPRKNIFKEDRIGYNEWE